MVICCLMQSRENHKRNDLRFSMAFPHILLNLHVNKKHYEDY